MSTAYSAWKPSHTSKNVSRAGTYSNGLGQQVSPLMGPFGEGKTRSPNIHGDMENVDTLLSSVIPREGRNLPPSGHHGTDGFTGGESRVPLVSQAQSVC